MSGKEYSAPFNNLKLREEFFTKVALIRILKKGYGRIENGYVVPKKYKEKEFNQIIKDTLKNVGIEIGYQKIIKEISE